MIACKYLHIFMLTLCNVLVIVCKNFEKNIKLHSRYKSQRAWSPSEGPVPDRLFQNRCLRWWNHSRSVWCSKGMTPKSALCKPVRAVVTQIMLILICRVLWFNSKSNLILKCFYKFINIVFHTSSIKIEFLGQKSKKECCKMYIFI